MNFYTIPVTVNERREVILKLSPKMPDQIPQQYIIEVAENMPFHLFGIGNDAVLRSFKNGVGDIGIADLESSFSLHENQLTLRLQPRQTVAAPEAAKEPKVATPVVEPLTYDDLDNYKPDKKVVAPAMPAMAQIESVKQEVGRFANCVHIIGENFSNGPIYALATLDQFMSNLLEEDFPELIVIIELVTGGQVLSAKMRISFAHPEQFLGIALDFGSESSQMSIKRFQRSVSFQEKKPEVENLFKNIYAYYKSNDWIARDDNNKYYQEEPATNFYKSIFFLKENLGGDYEDIQHELFIQDHPENLKMLVNTHDGYTSLSENKYYQLPNLKLTHKYDENFSSINFDIQKDGYDLNIPLSEMKDKIYNSILKVIIESYLKKEFIKFSNAKRKIRFILLVPNIYDHADITRTQLLLYKIFNDMAAHQYKGRILATEIVTISESDASFLGYINKNDVNVQKNKDYIIIDSGKGTTDLSIIRTGRNNVFNIKPVYRNGFAGAGNMLTFAAFETVLHFIRANTGNANDAYRFIRNQIIQVLKGNDLERKNNFYQALERLKFNYRESNMLANWIGVSSGDIRLNNISSSGADISTLTDLLQQLEGLSDFYGYIADTCALIAHRVAGNIRLVKENKEDFDCGGVILTGRAFLFKPLADAMRKELNEELGIGVQMIHTLSGNELKDVCIKGVFNNSVRLNAEKTGYPIQVMMKEAPPQIKEENKMPKRKFSSRLLALFFDELKAIEQSEAIIATDKNLKYNALPVSQIIIGSKRFKVKGTNIYQQANDLHTTADIVFTPDGYLVRQKLNNLVQHVYELSEIFDHEKVEMNMVVPSLFPNFIDENYIYSATRDDIRRAPLIPPLPVSNPVSTSQAPPDKPKGPIYF